MSAILPRLLVRTDAAAYCGLSVPTFNFVCQVQPVSLGAGKRMERFDRVDLDRWIDAVKRRGAKSQLDEALEALNGETEDCNPRH